MIDLIRAWKRHAAYGRRLFAFAPAFLIAESLYKFHSFALECLAFLVTWLVFDLVIEFAQLCRNGMLDARDGRGRWIHSSHEVHDRRHAKLDEVLDGTGLEEPQFLSVSL